jgi:hypothetical protein
MPRRLLRIILFLTAAVIGGTAAWWVMPHWNDSRAISQIVSDDQAIRNRGWRWLTSARVDDPTPRASRVIDRINRALADAGDNALLRAADALRPMDLWGWNVQPIDLALRELALRAESRLGDQQLAAIELCDCPFDAPRDAVLSIGQRLVKSADAEVRTLAMRGLLQWVGIDRVQLLQSLEVPGDDQGLERLRRLAMSWGNVPLEGELDDSAEITRVIESVDVLEAALLQLVRAEPVDAARLIQISRNWHGDPQPAFAYVLRHSNDPATKRELQRMADRGDDTARFALQARDPDRDVELAADIAIDGRGPIWRRRLAAWRMLAIDTALLTELLAPPTADADESVYAVALLAERHHDRGALVELAEKWMRDLGNDRKRAGALLAALLGEHSSLLEELAQLPDAADVRTTARLASAAVRDDTGRDELIELAYRALRKPDGDFDPDTVLAMLAAGYVDMLALLADPPRGDWRMAIQQRAMLIERFLPHWHHAAGRPVSGDERAILLHFDWLRARHHLESRRLEFDRATRTYRVTPVP